MRILIIEDNVKTVNYLRAGLTQHYFVVETALEGMDGLHLATTRPFDLIILDVMLPGIDGWSILQKIRDINQTIPILFLTARDSVLDRVKGLNLGADDYLIKPFAFSELIARVKSLLRRKQPLNQECLEIANLRLEINKHKAYRGGKKLNLTAKEFMLLLLMAERQGDVLSRSYIAEQVWDINFDNETNAIDVAIKRLRDKVDHQADQKLIHTVRGIGYVLEVR